jgi:hypothetical protein
MAGIYFIIPAIVLENCRDQEKTRATPFGSVGPEPSIDLSNWSSLDPKVIHWIQFLSEQ